MLAMEIIHGTAFIDKKSLRIDPKSRQIVSKSNDALAIAKSFEDGNAAQLVNGTVLHEEKLPKLNPLTCQSSK